MISTVQEWGNSQGIRIPKSILKEANISTGQKVEIAVESGNIILKNISKRKSIKELFDGFNGSYKESEVDWGTPAGKEIW